MVLVVNTDGTVRRAAADPGDRRREGEDSDRRPAGAAAARIGRLSEGMLQAEAPTSNPV